MYEASLKSSDVTIIILATPFFNFLVTELYDYWSTKQGKGQGRCIHTLGYYC